MTNTADPFFSLPIPGYTFVEAIYQGTRTMVYRAVEAATQQPVVIKVQSQEYPSFAELVQFRNQYAVAKNLPIPGIVHPLSLESCGDGYALVMEDFEGIDLEQYVQQHPLSLIQTLDIAIQLADILHELQQHRVIHKDLKPTNILIHPDSKQVKLIDFSIASLLSRETQAIQSPHSLEGTLAYMAPEQTGRMNRAIDYRTDFYTLGVTLYQLLTGQLPFAIDDPMELIHCHIAKVPVPPEEFGRPKTEDRSQESRVRSQAFPHPPISPSTLIPKPLSDIVLKLMAKNAEDRYQSALGLKYDLEQCLTQWQEQGEISEFSLGQRDLSDRFLIPEKLYGREAEVKTLLDAFDRVSQGASELMLVVGFSGIGKTAVVNEVHKPIVRQRGYFIRGKFDQFNRNIPFSAFVQAFRNLVAQLLSESSTELHSWKTQILDALGENAQVIIDLIPELEKILGSQPPAPEISGTAVQNRFNLLFQKFIQVFTTPAHPLVVFVDDLQWADSASLNLIQVLVSESKTENLLVVGAYRNNEIFPTHPLMLTLEAMDKVGAAISTLNLQPLKIANLNQLITDILRAPAPIVRPLTELVMQKTQGNPFFATQFLNVLHQDQLISFDPKAGYWQCDMAQVKAAALTDDVVELMALQLQKLPERTQAVLKLAACIGAQFDLETLAIASEKSQTEVAVALWKALQTGIILPQSDVYKFYLGSSSSTQNDEIQTNLDYFFLHDRIQQAAYSLIPEPQKEITHLKIGKLFIIKFSDAEIEDEIFDIVRHWNIGLELVKTFSEREKLCQLNLQAALKAKRATAYEMAYQYVLISIGLLPSNGWQNQYSLMLALHELAAESAYLKGDFDKSQHWSQVISQHAQNVLDEVKAYEINLLVHVAQRKSSQAIALGQQILEKLGVSISTMPTSAEIQQTWTEVGTLMPSDQNTQSLLELPVMTDTYALAALQILNSMAATVYLTQPQLFPLIVLAQIKLSLLHGNTAVSAGAYARYSFMLCSKRSDISSGYEFGRLAIELSERFDHKGISTRVLLMFGALTLPWTLHLKESIPLLQEAYRNGLESGNLDGAALSHYYESQSSYLVGQELDDLAHKVATYSAQIQQIKQEFHFGNNELLRQVILNLIGNTASPHKLIGEAFDEDKMLTAYQSSSNILGLYCLYLHKAILCYWFNRIEEALEYIEIAANYLIASTSQATVPLFYLYDSLTRLSVYANASTSEQTAIITRVDDNQKKMEYWARHAPMNFQHKYDLVLAEKYYCLGQKSEAIDAYDHAISEAKNNGYIQEEALANELAAKFYLDWGKEKIAADYLQEAYYCYSRWGAKAKVADLETRYPDLLHPILHPSTSAGDVLTTLMTIAESAASAHPTSHCGSGSANLNQTFDFSSILKAAQVLSSTIQLDELLCQFTQIILQNSGSDRCALILPGERGEWQVRAIATVENIQLCTIPLTDHPQVPIKLIQYVKNTQESVVIDTLATDLPVMDDYLCQQQPQSVLSLPLLNQESCIGVIVLENQLASGVFTDERIIILNFLCTQAAISLDNSRLYESIALKSFAIESAVDGTAILEDEKYIYLNAAHACLFGYESHELLGQSWEKLYTPIELQRIKSVAFPVLEQTGRWSGEVIALRKDGSTFDEELSLSLLGNGKLICICRDISDRKVAEEQLRVSEQRYATLAAAAPVGIFRTDAAGHCIYVNNRWCQIADLTPEAAAGYGWQQGLHPDDRDLISGEWDQSIHENRPFQLEYRFQRSDGQVTWVFGQSVAEHDADGQIIGYVGTITDISDRKASEIALRQSEAHYRALVDANPDLIMRISRDGFFLEFAMPPTFSLLGNIADWVGAHVTDALPTETAQQRLQAIQDALETQTLQMYEQTLVVDGKIQHEEVRVVPYAEDEVLLLVRDISDRKATEQKLLESKTFLKTVLDTFPLSVFWKDRESRYIGVNRNFAQDAGFEKAEAIAGLDDFDMPWAETEAQDYRADDQEVMRLDMPKLGIIETQIQANGNQIWLETNKLPLHDLDGNVIGVLGTYQDISNRKRAEAAVLQKSQDLEKALADLQNTQLKLIQSEKMSALGGLVAGVAHEINNPTSCIIGNVDVAQDYFDDLLGLLDRYADQFPQPGADIENELQAVDLEYVCEDLPKLMRAMRDAGDRIQSISTSLRTFSRDDKATKQLFDIREGIESTLLILRHRLKANEYRPAIEVEADYGEIPEIYCFPGQLNQVFMNILANAIDMFDEMAQRMTFEEFKNNPQKITIQTEKLAEQNAVEIQILDNGTGIPDEMKSRIFDHLFTTKGVGKGTGLGLAIARQIVIESHGGSLDVRSKVGQGSEFCLRLPINHET